MPTSNTLTAPPTLSASLLVKLQFVIADTPQPPRLHTIMAPAWSLVWLELKSHLSMINCDDEIAPPAPLFALVSYLDNQLIVLEVY